MKFRWFPVVFLLVLFLMTGACTRNGAGTAVPQGTPTKPTGITFEQPIVLDGHKDGVSILSWSLDGSLLASSSGGFEAKDDTIRIWHADGTLSAELEGHSQPVTGLSWSPDGKILASSSMDETIRLWRPDGSLIRVLQGHAGRVFSVAWSPDGKTLASGSIVSFLNPTVQLWDLDGKIIKSLSTSFSGGKFYNLGWSADGQFLLGGATDYKLWRQDGTQVFWRESSEHSTPAWGMAWAPNGKLWAIGDENGAVFIFNTEGIQVAEVHDRSSVNSLAWSPDSKALAGSKTLWRADGSIMNTLTDQTERVSSVAWSPDGKILASAGSDSLVHLWTAEGRKISTLSGHTGNINMIAWSPNGKVLASASEDKTIRLWRRR